MQARSVNAVAARSLRSSRTLGMPRPIVSRAPDFGRTPASFFRTKSTASSLSIDLERGLSSTRAKTITRSRAVRENFCGSRNRPAGHGHARPGGAWLHAPQPSPRAPAPPGGGNASLASSPRLRVFTRYPRPLKKKSSGPPPPPDDFIHHRAARGAEARPRRPAMLTPEENRPAPRRARGRRSGVVCGTARIPGTVLFERLRGSELGPRSCAAARSGDAFSLFFGKGRQ